MTLARDFRFGTYSTFWEDEDISASSDKNSSTRSWLIRRASSTNLSGAGSKLLPTQVGPESRRRLVASRDRSPGVAFVICGGTLEGSSPKGLGRAVCDREDSAWRPMGSAPELSPRILVAQEGVDQVEVLGHGQQEAVVAPWARHLPVYDVAAGLPEHRGRRLGVRGGEAPVGVEEITRNGSGRRAARSMRASGSAKGRSSPATRVR